MFKTTIIIQQTRRWPKPPPRRGCLPHHRPHPPRHQQHLQQHHPQPPELPEAGLPRRGRPTRPAACAGAPARPVRCVAGGLGLQQVTSVNRHKQQAKIRTTHIKLLQQSTSPDTRANQTHRHGYGITHSDRQEHRLRTWHRTGCSPSQGDSHCHAARHERSSWLGPRSEHPPAPREGGHGGGDGRGGESSAHPH